MNELRHVGIILDGNGRWAKEKGMPRIEGHKEGIKNIERIALYAKEKGIKVLSIYCFSTENWDRPKEEVDFLMNLPVLYLENIDKYNGNGIKVLWSGRRNKVPKETFDKMNELVEKTKDNSDLILNVCYDYGSLYDIKEAILKMDKNDISEKSIYDYLSSRDLGMVDLLIRPGGEKRLSNFMILECAYAELYFTDVYWPDFNEFELDKAIDDYYKRDRRFGSIK